jgi:putative ABC transport system substrate-binding protein
MKRLCIGIMSLLVVLLMVDIVFAQQKTFSIEVLQVTDVDPFERVYQGFMQELNAAGLEEGKNLKVNRRIIDFDIEKGGLWKKVGVLLEIRRTASKIVEARPDLVMTIATPATKYAKDRITAAGIPLVFSAVIIPEAAGCKSLTVAGPGFTGSSIYMEMADILKITRLAFPGLETVGVIHTDDDNTLAQVEQLKAAGPGAGFTFITKEVNKSDKFTPPAQELIAQGAQAFVVPLDTYYGLRDYEPCAELSDISIKNKMPVLSLVHMNVPGALLYIGSDLRISGALSGKQAAKILLEGANPDDLPILRQEDLAIMVDTDVLKSLQIELPMEILMLAKDLK